MKHFDVALSRNLRFTRCRFPVFSRTECRPVDAVPLVDMALVFLLMLVMTSSVVRRPGLMVELPLLEDPVSSVPYNRAVVSLVGMDRIYLEEQQILPGDLPAALRRMHLEFPGESLVVEISGDTPSQRLTEVMHAGRQAGFARILLATESRAPVSPEPVTP